MITRQVVQPVPADEDSRPYCDQCCATGCRGVPSEQWIHTCVGKQLSANDIANLEKIAQLRGHLGKLRAQIVMARDILLRYEHRAPKPDYPVQALTILSAALEIPAP